MKSEKLSLPIAVAWIVGSTVIINGFAATGILLWNRKSTSRKLDERFEVSAIVQTGPEREALKTLYLAELMGLSKDNPINLFTYSTREWEKQLLKSPLIKQVEVRRLPPSTLHIDYTVRTPLARMGEYENLAIDEKGYLFPINPFLTPKQLTEFFLGEEEISFDKPIHSKAFALALELQDLLTELPNSQNLRIDRIDVSQAFAPSYGRREIIVLIKAKKALHYLRLSTTGYAQELGNYTVLLKQLDDDQSRVIDLRIPKLAYIDTL